MKHTMKQFVHYKKDEWNGKETFALFGFDATNSSMGYIKICEAEVSFEVPDDFNPVTAQLEVLALEEARVRAEFNQRIAQIKEQIGKLQALTYEVPA